MYKKIILISTMIVSLGFSQTLKETKKLILENNQNLKIFDSNIEISMQNEYISGKWKNIILGVGINDILINNLSSRDKEAMQTQFVTFTQEIPLGDSLSLKSDISKTQTMIYKLLKVDKNILLNSIVTSYYNEYKIVQKKLSLIFKYKQNIKEIKDILVQRFENRNIGQIEITNTDIMMAQLDIKQEQLVYKLNTIKTKIENLTFVEINKVKSLLVEPMMSKIDLQELYVNHPLVKAYTLYIKKSKQNIELQRAKKFSSVKVSVGYYQRENFDDYLALKVAIPLSIYGIENAKINKAKQEYKKQENLLSNLKNEFKSKVRLLEFEEKIAISTYKILKNKIIQQKEFIGEILDSQSSIKNISSSILLKNLNEIIKQEILALDELSNFYKAKSKLLYFTAKRL